MKQKYNFLITSLFCSQMLFMTACSDSDNNNDFSDIELGTLGLPEALNFSLLNQSTGAYYSLDTSDAALVDLNELADTSQDSAVQKLKIIDTSTIGHFLHWPDFREVDGEEQKDLKYLLMRPDYVPGEPIDADKFVQLVHFHDDELAAHSADEFSDPEPGSGKAAGLERLNSFVAAQKELEDEISEVMPDGETLCRAFIDPYQQYELAEEEAAEAEEEHEHEGEEEHEHGELTHFALSDSGRIYFFAEESAGLEEIQGFVKLDEVSSITDCNRTTIMRASDDGILVFIPDTQRLYLVDSHGGDFHQHSTWTISSLLPEGVDAGLIAIIGGGESHEHDDDHDHE